MSAEFPEPSMTTGADMVPLALPPQVATAPMQMLQLAVDRGASIDVLTKLMDLQERLEASQARREFDAAFAAVKAKVGVIKKTGVGHQGKAYADLADIARVLDPAIAEHGLSYRFRSQRVGNELVMTCVVCHRAGHYEENSLPGPLDTSGSKNPIQAVGSTATYLQRYTLIQAFGLSASVNGGDIHDDDGEGASVKKGWPQGSIYQDGDYAGGTPEGKTKPKQENKYTRVLNAAATHADNARAYLDKLRQCETIEELDETAIAMEAEQAYKNLPAMFKTTITTTYNQSIVRIGNAARSLHNQVVHDTDDMEPRPATPDDFTHEDAPKSISERANAVRDGQFQDYVTGRPSRKNVRPETPEEIADMLRS